MDDLPIRKVPGIGRVNERLLDAIGIKVRGGFYHLYQRFIIFRHAATYTNKGLSFFSWTDTLVSYFS